MICGYKPLVYKIYTKDKLLHKTKQSSIILIKDSNGHKFILKKQSRFNSSLMKYEVNCLKHLQSLSFINTFIYHEYYIHYSYLVLDYIDGCTLADYLDTHPSYTKKEVIIKQLIDIFKQIHEKRVIHRDIKLENIMIANDKLTIIDFGYSIIVKDIDSFSTNVPCGSLPYMCPEMIEHTFYNSTCDTWSLGVLFYALLTTYFPYRMTQYKLHTYQMMRTGFKEVVQNIKMERIQNNKMKTLIKQMLVYDRDNRIAINKIIF